MADVQRLNGQIVAALKTSRKNLIYASMSANPLFAYFFKKKKYDLIDGGYQLSNPLILGRNPNVSSYSHYDKLPIVPTDEFGEVNYSWSRYQGSFMMSNQEIDENTGEGKIFDLFEQKMNVLKQSFEERLSVDLYGLGEGKNMNGLPMLIPDDPTTGVLGGIDRAKEKQWRTMAVNANGTLTKDNICDAFDDIMTDMAQGKNNKPDVIICGKTIFNLYKQAINAKRTFQGDGSYKGITFDMGFESFAFNQVEIIYDENCPANKAYFINTEFLKLHIMKNVNMKVMDLAAPADYDVVAKRIVLECQLCLWKAYRTHAVLIG